MFIDFFDMSDSGMEDFDNGSDISNPDGISTDSDSSFEDFSSSSYDSSDNFNELNFGGGIDSVNSSSMSWRQSSENTLYGNDLYHADRNITEPLEFSPNDDASGFNGSNEHDGHNVSFEGSPKEQAEWAKKAQSEKEWADWEKKQADSCLSRNDINGYKNHLELMKKHAAYYDKYISLSRK